MTGTVEQGKTIIRDRCVMRELISYTCTKCGAALNVEVAQKIYECPFCGADFDFTELHHNELVKDASESLKRFEFATARENYEAILESEPGNFEGLCGLILCRARFISPESFKDLKKWARCDASDMISAIDDVAGMAGGQDAPYFSKLSEIVDITRQIASVDEEIEEHSRKIKDVVNNNSIRGDVIISGNSKTLTKRKDELTADFERACTELDALAPAKEAPAPNYDPHMTLKKRNPGSIEKSGINCAKCAGSLEYDREQNIYRCDHCGVAYGSSLFTDDPVKKAFKAMRNGEFSEADQHFTFALMLDSMNVIAYRGRVLCAAKVMSFDALKPPYIMSKFVAKSVRECANEALRNLPVPLHTYFASLKSLADACEDYALQQLERSAAAKKAEEMGVALEHFIKVYNADTDGKDQYGNGKPPVTSTYEYRSMKDQITMANVKMKVSGDTGKINDIISKVIASENEMGFAQLQQE